MKDYWIKRKKNQYCLSSSIHNAIRHFVLMLRIRNFFLRIHCAAAIRCVQFHTIKLYYFRHWINFLKSTKIQQRFYCCETSAINSVAVQIQTINSTFDTQWMRFSIFLTLIIMKAIKCYETNTTTKSAFSLLCCWLLISFVLFGILKWIFWLSWKLNGR